MKEEEKQPQKFSKWLIFFLIVLVIFPPILWVSSVLIFKNWSEIIFAIKKPAIVKSIRVNYENKQKQLEESFFKTEKTSEEKLIDAVTQELKK